jgi:glycosyltransferase involved in cell wall biosynthesis
MNKTLTIGLFTSNQEWGGSEQYLYNLADGLLANGHRVIFFGVAGSRLFDKMTARNIQCVAWKTRDTHSSNATSHPHNTPPPKKLLLSVTPLFIKLSLGIRREIKHLIAIFRDNPVDVMHININGYENAGYACRQLNIPSLGMHCIMPEQDVYWFRSWKIKNSCRSYTLLAGKSDACTKAWQALCARPPAQMMTIWNGIDTSTYRPIIGPPIQPPFKLLYVGRLHPMKAIDKVLRALAACKENVYLSIVGDGPSREELLTLSESLGLQDKVSFEGYQKTTAELYHKHHALILTSVSHESFGTVLIEAMACALPLITTDYGPFPEINIHEQTGLIVKSGSTEALAEAIDQMATHPSERERMSVQARFRAKQHFSINKMISNTLAAYRKCMSE